MRTTHYHTLDLPENAAQDDIHAAYKTKVQSFAQRHKAGNPVTQEAFDALEDAYATLRDPEKRAAYDRQLSDATPAASPGLSQTSLPDDGGAPNAEEGATGQALEVPGTPITHTFEFTGSGGQYFRIWIVNLLLSIVTLGIYSAWAKVRREQYFHRNLLLEGSGFDYHGNPLAILKGRFIAYGLLIALGSIQKFYPDFYLIALVAVSPIYPWLLVRSFRFRARNTSYRGLRFNFDGTYKRFLGAFWVYILLFLGITIFQGIMMARITSNPAQYGGNINNVLMLVTLLPLLIYALLVPDVFRKLNYFKLNHLSFGGKHFECAFSRWSIYKIFLLGGLILFVLLFSFVILLGMVTPSLRYFLLRSGSLLGFLLAFLTIAIFLFIYALSWTYIESRMTNRVWNSTALSTHRFVSDLTLKGLLWIRVSNYFLTLITLGLYWPFGKIRLARFRARHTALIVSGSLDDFIGEAIQDDTHALGEELADAFDFDIAI